MDDQDETSIADPMQMQIVDTWSQSVGTCATRCANYVNQRKIMKNNDVSHLRMADHLNLNGITLEHPEARTPSQFIAAVVMHLQCRLGLLACLTFLTGTLVSVGARSPEQLFTVLWWLECTLEKLGISTRISEHHFVNSVLAFRVGGIGGVDLAAMNQYYPAGSHYRPNSFPGLRKYVQIPDTMPTSDMQIEQEQEDEHETPVAAPTDSQTTETQPPSSKTHANPKAYRHHHRHHQQRKRPADIKFAQMRFFDSGSVVGMGKNLAVHIRKMIYHGRQMCENFQTDEVIAQADRYKRRIERQHEVHMEALAEIAKANSGATAAAAKTSTGRANTKSATSHIIPTYLLDKVTKTRKRQSGTTAKQKTK